jgi:hypothetical protein
MSKHEFRLTFAVKKPSYLDSFQFTAHVVHMVKPEPSSYNPNDAGVRNPMGSDYFDGLAGYAGLGINAFRNVDEGSWYGFEVQYMDLTYVSQRQVEEMAKVIRGINRKLDRYNAEFGAVEDLAAYCGRVARALGCKTPTPFGEYCKEVQMTGTHYKWRTVDALRSVLESTTVTA